MKLWIVLLFLIGLSLSKNTQDGREAEGNDTQYDSVASNTYKTEVDGGEELDREEIIDNLHKAGCAALICICASICTLTCCAGSCSYFWNKKYEAKFRKVKN